MYDYKKAIENDIITYLNENLKYYDCSDFDELKEKLVEDLFNADGVTGNICGSYTLNRFIAKEYVLDNLDLLKEASEGFLISKEKVADDFLNGEWEELDTIIRCYLLDECLNEVLDSYDLDNKKRQIAHL